MKKIKSIYFRHREIINYLFFGGCTTLFSWGTYAMFVGLCGMRIVPGKALSWLCAVVFAYVTNKLWVFFSRQKDAATLLREAAEFFMSRAATGVVEIAGLPLLIKLGLDQPLFDVPGFWANIVVTVIIVVLNYILSKFIVFRKKESE